VTEEGGIEPLAYTCVDAVRTFMNIQVMSYAMPSSVPWEITLSISGEYKEKSKYQYR
jgi:hypothetical protein